MKQSGAGTLFGDDVSAFSEYERGKTQPRKSTILLCACWNDTRNCYGR
ncbi:MAG: type II toxin-antitoxin system MqsA family antitoxin [Zoogloeaceae bacterium]|nr:type II toxin-antitoxin system MqsA family antitoxin [Zoogloeaceae bacterium]